jgi:hypothetical protein
VDRERSARGGVGTVDRGRSDGRCQAYSVGSEIPVSRGTSATVRALGGIIFSTISALNSSLYRGIPFALSAPSRLNFTAKNPADFYAARGCGQDLELVFGTEPRLRAFFEPESGLVWFSGKAVYDFGMSRTPAAMALKSTVSHTAAVWEQVDIQGDDDMNLLAHIISLVATRRTASPSP